MPFEIHYVFLGSAKILPISRARARRTSMRELLLELERAGAMFITTGADDQRISMQDLSDREIDGIGKMLQRSKFPRGT
jgi:hypothetical protein